jgi:hypothetical protein
VCSEFVILEEINSDHYIILILTPVFRELRGEKSKGNPISFQELKDNF